MGERVIIRDPVDATPERWGVNGGREARRRAMHVLRARRQVRMGPTGAKGSRGRKHGRPSKFTKATIQSECTVPLTGRKSGQAGKHKGAFMAPGQWGRWLGGWAAAWVSHGGAGHRV